MNPPNADKCKTPTAMEGKVLASLCITCCNQERFIRDAVQSAFDQTYSPLEIVISDDASTDRTAQIVQEMIAAYKGPHKVAYGRYVPPLGLGALAPIAAKLAMKLRLGRAFRKIAGIFRRCR